MRIEEEDIAPALEKSTGEGRSVVDVKSPAAEHNVVAVEKRWEEGHNAAAGEEHIAPAMERRTEEEHNAAALYTNCEL
jgi:hypothetical protein